MSGRDAILGRLRRSLGRDGPPTEAERRSLETRLAAPKPNLIPKRSDGSAADRRQLFEDRAALVDVTVHSVGSLSEVPGAVATFLSDHNLPPTIRIAPDLDAVPWAEERPMLTVEQGPAVITDWVGVTPAFAGIAETGTLMTVSGPGTPATLNFVPDNHVVVLRADQIVGSMEAAWSALRAEHGSGTLPRTVNFISGPSKTADIEQMLVKGAHGPRRLHIVMIDEDEAQTPAQQ